MSSRTRGIVRPSTAATLWVLCSLASGQGVDRRIPLEDGGLVRIVGRGDDVRYLVRHADGRESGWRRADHEIRLRHGSFDPLERAPVAAVWPATGRQRILQTVTPMLEEFEAPLRALGVVVHRHAPGQSVIAQVPEATESAVRALPFVRWLGDFPAEARIDPEVIAALAGAGSGRCVVQLMQPARPGAGPLRSWLRDRGIPGDVPSPDGHLVYADLTLDQVAEVAALDAVLWIELAAAPTLAVDQVRVDAGFDVVEAITGFSGEGVRGEVLDSGLEINHPDFQAHRPILHGQNHTSRPHGTAVNGIVFGTGATLATARGLLPDGQSIFASFYRLGDRYQHTRELLEPPYEVVFQTNSWGNGPSPAGYPSLSFQMDNLAWQYDLVMCQAFGNTGSRRAFRQAWAKNIVTVGGIRHRDTLDLADDEWRFGASRGPATDGRIKPDLAYWRDRVHTTSPNAHTQGFGGTSAATPQVAGVFGLFFQMWHAEVFGNVASGVDVFTSRPSSATARAFVYHAADAYDFAGTTHDLTRTHQGWGRPDAEALLAVGDEVLVVDEDRRLRNHEVARYRVRVSEGAPRLRATMVYTDPPGNSAAAEHRVNDLSLRLTAPSGMVYWGNQGLDAGNESTPGGAANRLDTTEHVWLTAPEPGDWTVEVFAAEVVRDADLSTPDRDATFALVVSPVSPAVRPLEGARAAVFHDPAPELTARGSFVPGAPWRFDLSGARPGARCALVVGAARVDRPHRGATMVPRPDVVLRATADAGGRVSFASPPDVDTAGVDGRPGLPPPSEDGGLWVQGWVYDERGVAATDALAVRVRVAVTRH